MLPKTKTILSWTLRILFGILFLLAGLPKLLGDAGTLARFGDWGYPARFAHVVGLMEISGALALFIPRFARYGALLIGIVMIGAFITHIFAQEWSRLAWVGTIAVAQIAIWKLLEPQEGSTEPISKSR